MARVFILVAAVLAQLAAPSSASCELDDVFDKTTGVRCDVQRTQRKALSPEIRTAGGDIQLIVNEGSTIKKVTRGGASVAIMTVADLEDVDNKVAEMQTKMATLDTLIANTVAPLATQTKVDLAKASSDLKADIDAVADSLKKNYATKEDIKGFASVDKVNSDVGSVKTDISTLPTTTYVDDTVDAKVAAAVATMMSSLDGILRRNAKIGKTPLPAATDYWNAKEKKWVIAPPPPPPPTSSADCDKAIKGNGNKNGYYPLKGRWGETKAYCHAFSGVGYTLVARVNGGEGKWTYGENEGGAWESGNPFGSYDGVSDYKLGLYDSMFPKRFMITRKPNSGGYGSDPDRVLESDDNCLGGGSLESFFRKTKWTCGGSVGFPNNCCHKCNNVLRNSRYSDLILNKNGNSRYIYMKAGERNGAQESNEDRAYISSQSSRGGVDAPTGLGSYCTGGCGGKSGSGNVGGNHDGVLKMGSSYKYEIWYRGIY